MAGVHNVASLLKHWILDIYQGAFVTPVNRNIVNAYFTINYTIMWFIINILDNNYYDNT